MTPTTTDAAPHAATPAPATPAAPMTPAQEKAMLKQAADTAMGNVPAEPELPALEVPDSGDGDTEPEEASLEAVSDDGEDGAPKPKKPSALAAIKRAKAEAQRVREKARAYAQQEESRLQSARQELQSAYQRLQADRAALEQLRSDPIAAIRAQGWDPEQLINNLAEAGTPEGKLAAKIRALEARQEALLKRDEHLMQERQQELERAKVAQSQQQTQAIYKAFLDAAKPDVYPTITKLYEPDELIQKGLKAYNDFAKTEIGQKRIRRTGVACTNAEVLEYLELKAKERMGSAAPVAKKGAKTLSASATSQSKSAQKPLDRLSPADEKKALTRLVDQIKASQKR